MTNGERPEMPYRYDVLLRVTVEGDGMHADGDGAMATVARLAELVKTDGRVVDAGAFPSAVRYLGRAS